MIDYFLLSAHEAYVFSQIIYRLVHLQILCRETTNAVQEKHDSGFPNSPHKPPFMSPKNPRGVEKLKYQVLVLTLKRYFILWERYNLALQENSLKSIKKKYKYVFQEDSTPQIKCYALIWIEKEIKTHFFFVFSTWIWQILNFATYAILFNFLKFILCNFE